jgi:hypothetical protein
MTALPILALGAAVAWVVRRASRADAPPPARPPQGGQPGSAP